MKKLLLSVVLFFSSFTVLAGESTLTFHLDSVEIQLLVNSELTSDGYLVPSDENINQEVFMKVADYLSQTGSKSVEASVRSDDVETKIIFETKGDSSVNIFVGVDSVGNEVFWKK